jgi:ethanolamine utilization protein EutN
MKLARVVGTVVSTINAPDLEDRTLLLCDLLDPGGMPSGGYLIAVDSVGAGAGETVLILDEGNSARQVLVAPGAPIRTVVVGIVDAVTPDAVADAVPPPSTRAATSAAPARSRAARQAEHSKTRRRPA